MKACTLTGPTLRLDPCLFLASLWPHSAFFIFHSIIPQIVLFSVIGSVALCCACAFSLREVEGSIPIVEWTRPRRERSPASRVSCRVLPLPPQARTLTGTYIRQSSHRAQTHNFGGEGRGTTSVLCTLCWWPQRDLRHRFVHLDRRISTPTQDVAPIPPPPLYTFWTTSRPSSNPRIGTKHWGSAPVMERKPHHPGVCLHASHVCSTPHF